MRRLVRFFIHRIAVDGLSNLDVQQIGKRALSGRRPESQDARSRPRVFLYLDIAGRAMPLPPFGGAGSGGGSSVSSYCDRPDAASTLTVDFPAAQSCARSTERM
jgi:hypothetical protein